MSTEKSPKGWAAVGKAAKDLAGQDRVVREQADLERERSKPGWMGLDAITARPHGDTRRVDPGHVLDMAESIAALGLLEPLVVDRRLHLLAGAHRWEAAKLLATADVEKRAAQWAALASIPWPCSEPTAEQLIAFDRIRALPLSPVPAQVPVRIVDIDAEAEGERAFSIEIAENEKRRDYTKLEVEALAERLSKAGYRMSRGKPKAGERALGPALAVIIGKSERTVRRLLGGDEDIRPSDLISDPLPAALRRLGSALVAVREAAKGPAKRKLEALLVGMATIEQELKLLNDDEK